MGNVFFGAERRTKEQLENWVAGICGRDVEGSLLATDQGTLLRGENSPEQPQWSLVGGRHRICGTIYVFTPSICKGAMQLNVTSTYSDAIYPHTTSNYSRSTREARVGPPTPHSRLQSLPDEVLKAPAWQEVLGCCRARSRLLEYSTIIMKLACVALFAAFAAAANHHLPRKIGDYCDAPEVRVRPRTSRAAG